MGRFCSDGVLGFHPDRAIVNSQGREPLEVRGVSQAEPRKGRQSVGVARPTEQIEPRLALPLVHEAAIRTSGFRSDRSLTRAGAFELANGLPFLASQTGMRDLLAPHTVDARRGFERRWQIAGRIENLRPYHVLP